MEKTGAATTQIAEASARGSYRNQKLPESNRDVFIDGPFDDASKPVFWEMVFTIVRSGFIARCALETDDAGDIRFQKIYAIVDELVYGIHDISRTETNGKPPLPRFNLPLELGLFPRRWPFWLQAETACQAAGPSPRSTRRSAGSAQAFAELKDRTRRADVLGLGLTRFRGRSVDLFC